MEYDNNNIFAKILRREIPCTKIYENEYVLAFYDINPQKKIHALVIPKGEYVNLDDFSSKASDKEIAGLIKGIGVVAKKIGVSDLVKGGGYRSLVNVGENGGQEVPHLHFHIFGGEKVGKMVSWNKFMKREKDNEIKIYIYPIKIKPEIGKTHTWPAEWIHVHVGKVLKSGKKYIVTDWIHFLT